MENTARVVTRLMENAPVKGAWASVCSVFSMYILDNITAIYIVFLGMYLVDFATGILKALKRGEFSSGGLRRGFAKWVGYSVTVGVLALVTNATTDQTTGWLWRWIIDWTLFYLMFQEYVSIAENLAVLGVNLPTLQALGDFVAKIKSTVNNNDTV